MTIDKRMKYEMQGGSKPARNYLGTQKTVSGIPVKWKSGPDAPSTELAYITKAEKDLLLKKNLHGSLKNGPNTGPDGIMSLDSQGDYTRDRSPQGRSRQGQAQHDQHMKSILTGQKNIGQTTKTGPKTRKYAVPEYVKVKQKDGTYKNKYIGSGYKSYGTPSFFGNLFSRGAPGYRGIKGMPAFWGKPKFDFKQGPDGMGYYSDYEKFGDTRDPVPLGIMGLIANAINKFKKPKDMTEFNKLTLGGTHPAALDFDPDAKIQDTSFSKTVTPDRYKYSRGPQPVNNYGIEGTTFNNPIGGVDQYAREMEALEKTRAGETLKANQLGGTLEDFYTNKQPLAPNQSLQVYDDNINFNNNVPIETDSMWDDASAKAPKSQLETWQEMFGEEVTPAGMNQEQIDYLNSVNKMNVNVGNTGAGGFYTYEKPQDVMDQINKLNAESDSLGWTGYNFDPDKIVTGDKSTYAQPQEVYDYINKLQPSTSYNYGQGTIGIADGGRVGYGNGGLATLFTRRG